MKYVALLAFICIGPIALRCAELRVTKFAAGEIVTCIERT